MQGDLGKGPSRAQEIHDAEHEQDLLDGFASAAIKGFISNDMPNGWREDALDFNNSKQVYARAAYMIAEAMLAERKKHMVKVTD